MNIYEEIKIASQRLAPYIYDTPLLYSHPLSRMSGGAVYLKLESEQYTGSFKARGALNKILALSPMARKMGVVAASTGNHARGLARALSITSTSGLIFVPENIDPAKRQALEYFKVPIETHGKNGLETEIYARQYAAENGKIYVSPYNDPHVIAGQGTIAAEITKHLFKVDDVLACMGGGGLMSGIGIWMQNWMPDARLTGCLPKNSPEFFLSMKKGEIVTLDEHQPTLSDGSAGGMEKGSVTFEICRQFVRDFAIVSEKQIAHAIRYMLETHHKLIEGAAGVALAGFLKDPERYKGRKVVIIICGGNIAYDTLQQALAMTEL
ncbi:MAG: threonine/serine dehydratase [Bacteroidota bacterium]